MNTTNDQQYITNILGGDTNAYAVLVDRYKDLVFTLAMKMLKSREEAEEIAQDTFLKAYRNLSSFKGDSKFSTWIYRITYNTCLDRLKKQKRQQRTVAIDTFTENEIKTLDNALDIMEQKERKQVIQDCLQLLSKDNAILLTLFYFEELTLREISKIMGGTVNNLKVKLYRGRKQLATILKARLEPEEIERYER
ncbi:MAG: RNA polymerase [Flavobacteriaceae bacterium]|nr:MAG: RNA polymerase [Flavobacteriaceae bacterium]